MQQLDPQRPTLAAAAVHETIAQILTDNGREATAIRDNDLLREELGFDSLDLAVLVVRLAQRLGVDPFRTKRLKVRSVGDLAAVYVAELETSP